MNCQGTNQNPAKSIFNAVSTPRSFQVAGVDGCKAGWLVAIVSGKPAHCQQTLSLTAKV
jgi:hypothetical protein